MASKKRTARKKSSQSASEMQSFRLAKDTIPFTSTRFTRQTLYWVIMLAFIFILQLWIVKLQIDIGALTDVLNATKLEQ